MFAKVIFIASFFFIPLFGYAQSIDQAKVLYGEGKYAEAKPVFEKLVKQSPRNSYYNLWYGVCCYETGDIKAAEKYLHIANKRKVKDSYKYLTQIYIKTYRFEEAIDILESYKALLKRKREDTDEAEAEIERVHKLVRMQEKTEDVQVIDSIVINKEQFLEAYNIAEECGSLMSYKDFFKTTDKISSSVYKNQNGNKIYYSHLSESGIYTLYSQIKLLDTWGDEKKLFPNSKADENYPFVLSDGVTMYFASKGVHSIGGYDIFVTRYNTNTNSYLTPELMGMPFNSPANDYMMVIDEINELGWFASDRNQPEDKVCVYLFIPDASRKRITDIEDPEELKKRSALSSIKDTWRNDADYSNLIALANRKSIKNGQEKKKDFIFVINDETTYYTMDQIKNHEARELYTEVIRMKKEIKTKEEKLEKKRTSYNNSSSHMREQLHPEILLAETQLYDLTKQIKVLEKKARNAENRQIKLIHNRL